MLRRIPNWQSALSAYLLDAVGARFEYGKRDCGLFVAGAIEAMTGVDVAELLRGRYCNRPTAFAVIRALCGAPTMEAVSSHLAALYGLAETPVTMAQRGDPVQLRRGRASSLGIVAMHGTEILTPYGHGLLRLPLSHATRAWHI